MLFVAICRALSAAPTAEGEVVGELKLFDRNPEFLLPWKLSFAKGSAGEQTFAYKIDTSNTRLVVSGRINPLTGDGSWQIEEGRVDVAVWLGLLAPQLGPILSGASAQGVFIVSGRGTLRQGQALGQVEIKLSDCVLAHAEQGWKLEGIAFKGEFALDLAAVRVISTAPFELTIGTITHPRFGARNLSLHAQLTERRTLKLSDGRIEIAGGEMIIDPAEVLLSPLGIDLNLHINRVGLQDIVLLVPAAGLADARGRIDGVVRAKWSAATDFQVGVGYLELRDDEPTVVRLTPSLGLLTGRLEPFIDFSPYIGKMLGRFIRPENPAYKDLQNVELGKSELRVTSLRVNLTPDGDEKGRSATVQFVAQPMEKGSTVKQVTFDVNVAGSLNQVLKVGMEQEFSIKAY